MNPSILPLTFIFVALAFSGCDTLQFLTQRPEVNVTDIEETIRVRFDETTGERRVNGPNIAKLYHNTQFPNVRLNAVINEKNEPEIRMLVTVRGSHNFGFKKFHTAMTSEGTPLEFVDARENVNVRSGPSLDPSSTGAYSASINLRETATVLIPLDYLNEKSDEGFWVTFVGETGNERVGITAEYAQAFISKLEAYM